MANSSKNVFPFGLQQMPGQMGHHGGTNADPMMDFLYSMGAPAWTKGGGGFQTRSIYDGQSANALPATNAAAAASTPAAAPGTDPNPMGKYKLPEWFWNWMMTQGVTGGVPATTTDTQGLLSE